MISANAMKLSMLLIILLNCSQKVHLSGIKRAKL